MFPDQVITSTELVQEMKQSYIEYAMSVIVGRALPDVRDGLKPVHRRILYAMYEDGLTRDKPFRKCATAVGDVLGRYHPHGDSSVYDALVRLAQDFSMRYPLIDGHGNFGSVDGDPPAAYRYTEARMSRIADEMLADIEKETVDWDPNFDETRKEPRVLPSRFPNLLVNGSSGIAVGMATNIPPHNLNEVIDATILVLDNPEATLEDLLGCIQGPDFPTKGIILGRKGIRAAYATGRGHITVRARTEFEEFGRDRVRIIVTELPYQVNKRMLIATIAEQVREKRIEGLSDIRDESDRNGMRIVIEIRKDANSQVVLNKLFAQTQMQTTFAVNMLALVNNQSQPRILSLRNILDEYIEHQKDIITRRTRYDLRKAQERAHLLEGLIIAQDNIDEVIKIIRNSYDDAKENLMERFGLSEIQASAILEMRLKALQGLEKEKLLAEYEEIEKKIEYYKQLLASETMLIGVLRDELTEIKEKYGDDRVTEIQDVENEIDIEDLIEEKMCVYTLTNRGYIKRLSEDNYKVQRRGGRGVTALTTREEDVVEEMFTCSTHDKIMFFTSNGRVYCLKGYEIPESTRQAKGMNIVNLLQLGEGE
ncbi:MAG: DNA gyrase subunit A, partial [Clostridia bacterium]|nr:DNA gyrase subunit A [Clostridia bacterium]